MEYTQSIMSTLAYSLTDVDPHTLNAENFFLPRESSYSQQRLHRPISKVDVEGVIVGQANRSLVLVEAHVGSKVISHCRLEHGYVYGFGGGDWGVQKGGRWIAEWPESLMDACAH